MGKLLAFLVLSLALAGCSGYSIPGISSLPSMDMSLFKSSPTTVSVRAESNPAGAEARSPGGTSCRTPCLLALPANGVSDVTFSLQGYLPQTVAVSVTNVRESGDMPEAGVADQVRIDPNPLFVALEPTPPPPPPARRRAPSKPRPKPAAAAPPPAQPQEAARQQPAQQGWAPPQQQPAQQGWGPPQQQPTQQGWGPPQQQQPGYR